MLNHDVGSITGTTAEVRPGDEIEVLFPSDSVDFHPHDFGSAERSGKASAEVLHLVTSNHPPAADLENNFLKPAGPGVLGVSMIEVQDFHRPAANIRRIA